MPKMLYLIIVIVVHFCKFRRWLADRSSYVFCLSAFATETPSRKTPHSG